LFKKLAYIFTINASYEGICVELERKQHNIGFPTFKLQGSTKNPL